jgi:hypothetical protein
MSRNFKRNFDRKLLLEDISELIEQVLEQMEYSEVKPDPKDEIWNMVVELEMRVKEELSNVNEIIDLATG